MHVAPIDFAISCLLNKRDDYCENYLAQRMNPQKFINYKVDVISHKVFNLKNTHIIGTQVCLISKEKEILLRKRGASLIFAEGRWDVSASGFCGYEDTINENLLFANYTINREVKDEIGDIRANPKRIRFTGLHFNKRTGATDILSFWQTETTSEEFIKLINSQYNGKEKKFTTKNKAVENYVWDSENLLVSLKRDEILESFRKYNIQISDFEPQSVICLQLTLNAYNKEDIHLVNIDSTL